jgi:hypothetical protein
MEQFDRLNVDAVVCEKCPYGGGWPITQVQFKDNTWYNVGQPDQGPHKEGGDDGTEQ